MMGLQPLRYAFLRLHRQNFRRSESIWPAGVIEVTSWASGYGLSGGSAATSGRFGLRFRLWFYNRRALAELAGRHGIDAMGGRSILRLIFGLNLRGWLRRGSHNRLRRGNCYRLLRDRQSGFGSLGNLCD